jgi:hypothetical protein
MTRVNRPLGVRVKDMMLSLERDFNVLLRKNLDSHEDDEGANSNTWVSLTGQTDAMRYIICSECIIHTLVPISKPMGQNAFLPAFDFSQQ